MEAVAEKKNGSDKRESSGNAETTSWKLSRDEVVRSRSGEETGMKIGRNVSLSQVPRPFNLNRCDIVVIVSANVPMCKDNVQRGGEKRTKSPGLARVRKPSCNTRHPQFTGNQRCECFVAVQGDEPDAPFIPRCHRRIISPRAHTHQLAPFRSVQQDRYVVRVINTRLGLRFRKIAPRHRARSLVCASTIYGRYGESLKNECAVRWWLCMIKKSCLPVRERARLPAKKREEREGVNSSRGFNQRALLTLELHDVSKRSVRRICRLGIMMPPLSVGIIIASIIDER